MLLGLGRSKPARAQAEAPARLLELAEAFLCADCADDIEADGVNRPMRRAMLADGTLVRAAEAARAAGLDAALPAIRRARAALESLDEPAALEAVREARAALR